MIVSKNFNTPNSASLKTAKANGIYDKLDEILQKDPDLIVQEIEKSGLRGKGGGGAPAGQKWKTCKLKNSPKTYLVINSDESEPGTCKDKYILNLDPHLLIEGIIISSHAIGAKKSFIYIRGEYEKEYVSITTAINEARDDGILKDLDIMVFKGAGAYICGEKTALLESIEGKRGHPRLKPHSKAEPDYLYGIPCVVNNVETISTVPFIVKNGFEAYRKFGTQESPGMMLFALSGNINFPQVKELAFGTSMLEVIEGIGGGVPKGLKAVIPGGSSTPILTAQEVSLARLDYESMRDLKSSLGTGAMIVLDKTAHMPKVLENLLEFYAEETCGQCTPCREGCGWALKIVQNMLRGKGKMQDLDTLKDICDMLNGKTICVFAPAVKDVIYSFITKFEDEFLALIGESYVS